MNKQAIAYASWLDTQQWDYFSTLTYKFDVRSKANRSNMDRMITDIKSKDKNFNMFWVTEFTNYNFSTHNHLLLKGDIKNDVNYHLKSKSLIGDHVKHEPYKEGASMYVSKYICDEKTNWGIIKNNS